MSEHVATAQCEIDAQPEEVWDALTNPRRSVNTCSARK